MCSEEVSIRGQESCLQRPAGMRPAKRSAEDIIEVTDEVEHAGSQILKRSKSGAFEQPARKDREPDLNLVKPRAVSLGVNKADAVRGILQKRAARLLGLEDPGLAFDTEGMLDPAVSGDQLDEHAGDQRPALPPALRCAYPLLTAKPLGNGRPVAGRPFFERAICLSSSCCRGVTAIATGRLPGRPPAAKIESIRFP